MCRLEPMRDRPREPADARSHGRRLVRSSVGEEANAIAQAAPLPDLIGAGRSAPPQPFRTPAMRMQRNCV
jgi:hypothetical protein